MFNSIGKVLESVSQFIWGPFFLIPLLLGAGLYLTFRLMFIQIRGFRHSIIITLGKYDKDSDPGEISHFKALALALSATIGTGNIVGVAAAITAGGPGAVFWMWMTAFLGMAIKFTSCLLAVHFRRIDSSGEVHGGPMHFIELGLGTKYKWLAVLFALFTALASFGIGNMFQVNNIVSAFNLLFTNNETSVNFIFNLSIGIFIALITALVILGGIKRIASFTSFLAPFMCAFYLISGITILIKNFYLVPSAFKLIFYHAFYVPESIAGGLLGTVIRHGVSRGLFSNEAGLGSSPIAHGAAKTNEPVREGFVAMLEPFIDTIIVCSVTALIIITSGAYKTDIPKGQLASIAFETSLKGSGWIVAYGIILFAFSTILSWSYYGDRAVDYLFGKKAVKPYRIIYIFFIILGACLKLNIVIDFCDVLNGLMAIPNLIALIFLSPLVTKLSKEYFLRMKNEFH